MKLRVYPHNLGTESVTFQIVFGSRTLPEKLSLNDLKRLNQKIEIAIENHTEVLSERDKEKS